MFSTARQAEPLLHPPAQEQSTRHQLRDSTLQYEVWSQFHNLLPVLAELYPPKPPTTSDSTAEGLSPRALRRRPRPRWALRGSQGPLSTARRTRDRGPRGLHLPVPRADPELSSCTLTGLLLRDRQTPLLRDRHTGAHSGPRSLPSCCCPIVSQRACKEPISK